MIFIFLAFLGLVIALVCLFLACEDISLFLLLASIVMLGFVIVFNPTEPVEVKYITSLYSVFNTESTSLSGGLFYTSSEEHDYLVYWTEEENFKRRVKVEIDWDVIEVYEDSTIDPAIIEYKAVIEPETNWETFVDTTREKTTRIKLYVPEGTIIPYIELK